MEPVQGRARVGRVESAPQNAEQPGQAQRPPLNRTALFAFVLSLLGLAMVVPIAGSIIGIMFGNRAMDRVEGTGERGGGLAQAAVIFGYFGLATVGIVVVFLVIIIIAASNSTS